MIGKNAVAVFRKIQIKHLLSVIGLCSVVVVLVNVFSSSKTEAAWYNESWAYRTAINITGVADTSKKVKVDIDTAALISTGKLQTDCGDSRFTDAQGVSLRYYIDVAGGACSTSSTDYYILVPTFYATGTLLYHYYGNPTVVNGTETSQFSEASYSSSTTFGSEEKGPGPMAAWSFDEAQGSITSDGTANQNTGTLTTPFTAISQQVNIVAQEFSQRSTSATPTDNSLGMVYYDGTKYNGETTYFETVLKNNNMNTSSSSTGFYNTIDCPSATDCKVVYYDNLNGDLMFIDCDDAICTKGTRTLIDGNTGCSLTGCSTSNDAGAYPSLDCIGATDCKISYFNVTGTDLYFADCDNAACSSGTTTKINGGSGCTLTNCATLNLTQYSSLDCSQGATDCKISYNNSGTSSLYFADCDNATCSSGTTTILDGTTSCVLTGCSTSASAGTYNSIDCTAGATDCKISYKNTTGIDLYFVDCDDATCSSGTTNLVDGNTGCALTNCQTADSAGDYSSLDCIGGGTDCKIAYYNSTDTDLFFADCDNATCTSGTTTLLDGNASCALTNCNTSSSYGLDAALDCSQGAIDCKIIYSNSSNADVFFADCASSTCSSGTRRTVDGTSGCGVTNCETNMSAGKYNALACSTGGSDCKLLYNSLTADGNYFVDCDATDCSSGTRETLDGYQSALNENVSLYCVSMSDCKLVYYDATDTALRFMDCDDTTCSTGTVTIVDGASGCSLSNCSTTNDVGSQFISLDCTSGTSDCKIAYYNATSLDLYFADCDDTSCSTGTRTFLDGGSGCPLTGCNTSGTSGQNLSMSCIGGGNDCKIAFQANSSKLYFADCDNGTCSSGSVTLLDGGASCSLTNCLTSGSTADYTSMDCSNGVADCKIAYQYTANTALIFADCDSATCSSGTRTVLDGDTGCTLSGCSTSGSASYDIGIDCSPGTGDCKISYGEFVSSNLYFADCDSATCSSGTTTLIDGNTGCPLTSCNTISAGSYFTAIDCNGSGSDCKLTYDSSGLVLADCDNATCTTGTVTALDATAGCVLTGCDTTALIASFGAINCSGGATDCKVASDNTSVNRIRFADCDSATCSSGSTTTADSGVFFVRAALYTDAGTYVPNSAITTFSNSYTRLRKPHAITLSDGEEYTVRLNTNNDSYSDIQAARIIVDQSAGSMTDTETQVPIGTAESDFSNTTYATVTNPPIYYYDSSQFSGTVSIYFEATLHTDSGSNTVSAQLLECTSASDCSSGSSVSGSELTHSGNTTWTRKRSAAITPATTKNYAVQLKMTAGTGDIADGKIIIDQTSGSGLSSTELVYPLILGARNDTDSTYTSQSTFIQYDPGVFSSSPTAYFEATQKTSAGTGYAQLYNSTSSSAIGSSEVTTAATAYERVRSAALTMPVSAANFDTQLKNSASNTTTVSSSKLILQVGSGAGAPDWITTQCARNGCLFFNGSTDRVTVANANSIDFDAGLSTGSTFQAWIKPNSDGENSVGQIFNKGANTYLRITNEGSDGKADLEAKLDLATTDATVAITDGLDLNKWQHVAMAYTDDSDDEITVYIDGIPHSSSNNGAGSPAADISNLYIGGDTVANFHGYIDEFKVFSYEKAAAAVKTDAQGAAGFGHNTNHLANGLLGYWKLNESFGNVSDSSGNNITLTNNGSTTFVNGKFANGSEHIPASSQYFSAASTVYGIKSISFWVNPDSTTNYFASLTASAYITSSSGTLSATGFTNPTIYVNGIQSSSIIADTWQFVTVTTATSINADTFYIGRQGSNYFDGTIDSVRIYNRVLPEPEVRTLYYWAPEPLIYLPLNENSGTSSVNDISGNSYTGTLSGISSSSWVPGKFGSALEFNGSSAYITLGTEDANLSSNNFTYSLWMYRKTDSAGTERLIDNRDANDDGVSLSITAADAIRCRYNATSPSTFDISLNTWYHVVCISDGSNLSLYINGKFHSSTTISDSIAESTDLRIGARAYSVSEYFPGIIDDIKIYNYARTPNQIIEDMNAGHPVGGSPIGSQVAYWKFDEGALNTCLGGTNDFCDVSVNGNDLTFSGSSAGFTNNGKVKKAFHGDGEVWGSRTDDADFDFTASEDFSITGWFKHGTASAAEVILQKEESSEADGGYRVQMESDGDISIGIDDDNTSFPRESVTSTAATYDDDLWHHFAAIKTGTTSLRLFIDSKEVGTADTSIATGSLANDDTFYIGDSNGSNGSDEFNGDLDEFKIYRAALTNEQLLIDYNAGRSTKLGNTGTSSVGTADNSSAREYCVPGDSSTCDTPRVEIKLDEATGTSAKDTSGNGNDLLSTSSSWISGKFGSAFDGTGANWLCSSNGSCADDDDFDVGSGSFTISFWYKSNSASNPGGQEIVMGKQTSANPGYLFRMGVNGKIDVAIGDGGLFPEDTAGSISTQPDTYDAIWHYVAAVKNGTSSLTLYTDGFLVETKTSLVATSSLSNSLAFYVADQEGSDGGNEFNGDIDQIRFYNYPRTQSQIVWEYNRGTPIAHYKFDECQGTTVADWSTNSNGGFSGNNGTITIGSLGTNDAPGTCQGDSSEAWENGEVGKFNGSLDFDGNDDLLTVTDTASLRPGSGSWSVFVWAKPDNSNQTGALIGKSQGSGAFEEFEMMIAGNVDASSTGKKLQVSYRESDANERRKVSTNDVVDGNWHQYGFVSNKTADSLTLYVDGQVVQTTGDVSDGSWPTIDNTPDLLIGDVQHSSERNFNGAIDDTRIYNYALTSDQVKQVYANQKAVRFSN